MSILHSLPKRNPKFKKKVDGLTYFCFLSRPPWWALKRGSVLSQNSSATSTLRGKILSRIRATTQVQIHENVWFFWNITYKIHSWQMYDWILLCIMKRYQKWAESQNQQYSSAFTLQAKNTTEQRSWSQLFFVLHFFPQSMQIFRDASFFNLAQSMLLPETRHVAIREPQNHGWIQCQYRFIEVMTLFLPPRAETMRVILNLKAPMKVTCLPNQQTMDIHQVTPHLPRPPQFSTRRITHTIHRFVKATPKVLLEKEPFSYFGETKKNKKTTSHLAEIP